MLGEGQRQKLYHYSILRLLVIACWLINVEDDVSSMRRLQRGGFCVEEEYALEMNREG